MNLDLFWLTEAQFSKIAPHLPADTRGNCFSPFLYRNRNAIERMFRRLKDFRRVATRYDRNAVNFLSTVCLAAVVSHWL